MPLSDQHALFRVLDVSRRIGVSLSASALMIPQKSVTALIGVSDRPQEKRAGGCEAAACGRTAPGERRAKAVDPTEIILLDGGMGTMLQAAGLPLGELPELWNLLRPETVTAVQRRYVEAGSRVLYTNTFGANRYKPRAARYGVARDRRGGRDIARAAAGYGLGRHRVLDIADGAAVDAGESANEMSACSDAPWRDRQSRCRLG